MGDVDPQEPRLDDVRLLVVDDDPDTLVVLRLGFEALGATVATAPAADEARSILAAAGVDIVITDLGVDAQLGRDVLRAAMSYGLPVIAVTGHLIAHAKRPTIGFAFDRVLLKPVTSAEIAVTVREVLAGRSSGPWIE